MEVDMVADMKVDMVTDMEVDMVADMEVDKVAKDMVASTVFEWGLCTIALGGCGCYVTLSKSQLQLIFRQNILRQTQQYLSSGDE